MSGSAPATRRLSFPSRVRDSLRRGANRILGADLAWSAAFVVVVVALLGTNRCGSSVEPLVPGEPAPHDVHATSDFDWIDQGRTEDLRRTARQQEPDAYVYDTERGEMLSRRLSALFAEGRLVLEQAEAEGEDAWVALQRSLGGRLPHAALLVLIEQRFDAAIEQALILALRAAMSVPVIGNRPLLDREPAITLLHVPGERAERRTSYADFSDLAATRERVRRDVANRLGLTPNAEAVLGDVAASFVDANVHFDGVATVRRRQVAGRQVPPVVVHVAAGDLLVQAGETLTSEVVERVEAVKQSARRSPGLREVVALAFLAAMLAFFLSRYSRYHQRGFRKLKHLHSLLVGMLLGMLLLARAVLWVVAEVVDGLGPPWGDVASYTYLIPLGGGAILIALLANGRIATVYSAFASLLFGAMNGWDAYLGLWAMIVQCAGVYAISTYRERSALLRAGWVVGGAGAASTLALETLRGGGQPLTHDLYGALLALLGGAVGVGLLISFSLPLLEHLYNVLTDLRLLELSNLNHPLLAELAVKAPGSYNHSLVVGTLAEEAAKAIGANSLFCRVAAFYHDVGKLNKPEYFVENQHGVNPHEKLAPSMSALVIAAHVKDGIKMAREARLPEQIIDIIPQHHGTKLMTYFYEKARQNADPELGPVQQDDFRYPGPKPQTREAAIFMLADAVEAAARTVEEPTANRLREMIRRVTNAIVLDGQLHSCDLTFVDLERIQEAFLRTLQGMYHHRVDYPGFDFSAPVARDPVSTPGAPGGRPAAGAARR